MINRALLLSLCAGAALACAPAANAQVVINEVFPNPPGGGSIDDRWEYIEIYGPAGMNLTGWYFCMVSGGQDPNGNDIPGPLSVGDPGDEVPEIDEAFSLDGMVIGSNGLLVIYNSNGAPSFIPARAAAGTTLYTYVSAHIPAPDTVGRIKNDGSTTFVLGRRRPGHTLTPAGASVYAPAYAWHKETNADVDYNGRIDFNGIGTLVIGGAIVPPETPVNSERPNSPATPAAESLEPYQMVDDVAWSHEGGKEYTRSQQQEISDTPGFNPDAVSRIAYYNANPDRGSRFDGEISRTRTADEEWIYGDIPSVPALAYGAGVRGGPTDQNGPTYNENGQLDPNGQFLLDDINLTGFVLTPGAFNDVDSSTAGGINITQFRFVRGDFDFNGAVDCDDKALIEQAASEGWTLDDMATLLENNNTDTDADDFTYTGWRFQGRDFNRVLAMIRMDLTDGSTGEFNSAQVVVGGQVIAWGGAVTAADLAAFNAAFPNLNCGLTCPACAADYDQSGGVDGDDISAFFSDWTLGAECADVDNSGGVDGDDIPSFFTVWLAGGC